MTQLPTIYDGSSKGPNAFSFVFFFPLHMLLPLPTSALLLTLLSQFLWSDRKQLLVQELAPGCPPSPPGSQAGSPLPPSIAGLLVGFSQELHQDPPGRTLWHVHLYTALPSFDSYHGGNLEYLY